MCESRCPKDVDLPRVMEAVRQVALRRGESRVVAKDIEPALLARAPQMVVVGALRRGEK
jgi:heterodisulfide reductase subunit C